MSVTIKSYRKECEARIINGLEKAMTDVKVLVQRDAMKNLDNPRGSGQHPQRQSGRLISNVAEFSHIEKDANTITAVIGSNIKDPPYPRWLEFGTPNGRQPPYPWLFPAVESNRQKIIDILKNSGAKEVSFEV